MNYNNIKSRQKRDLTGFLTVPLNSVDWHKRNITDKVKFNPQRIEFGLRKLSNAIKPELVTGPHQFDSTGTELLFNCGSCIGETDVSYDL